MKNLFAVPNPKHTRSGAAHPGLLLLLATMLFLQACEEREIEIPSLSAGIRRVLAEEATGVKCPQCPDGTRTLISLQQSFKNEGRELIVVSLHAAGSFSIPFSSSSYDFRSADAQALASNIGPLEGFPCAAINRRLLPNETSAFITPHTRWEGVIREDFNKDYGVEVAVKNSFNPNTRVLDIEVILEAYEQNVPSGNKLLTVLITQDSIIDVQDDKGTIKPNYVHRHILRDVVSNPGGDPVTEPLTLGAKVKKSYSLTLPGDFEEKHCNVVAYLHFDGNPSKEVLQAAEEHVIE